MAEKSGTKILVIVTICIMLISIIIARTIMLNLNKEEPKPNKNNTISIKELLTKPMDYLNKTVNLTGKINYRNPDGFALGPRYFDGQIKREYIFIPLEYDTWKEYLNGTYTFSDVFIEIYSNNLSFNEYLGKNITITGYFREFPSEFKYSDELEDTYYIDVINITLIDYTP